MTCNGRSPIRRAALASLAGALLALSPAPPNGGLRAKVYAAFADVRSYRLTVLGSVRSLGVWVAPDRYQMTTEFEGKPIKTLIVGRDYWTYSGGKWMKSATASSKLDIDIAGLLRVARSKPAPFVPLPDQNQDGRRVGTFSYTFENGTEEICNFDRKTYLVTRCKADDLTLLYSGYNDPSNRVAKPSK